MGFHIVYSYFIITTLYGLGFGGLGFGGVSQPQIDERFKGHLV